MTPIIPKGTALHVEVGTDLIIHQTLLSRSLVTINGVTMTPTREIADAVVFLCQVAGLIRVQEEVKVRAPFDPPGGWSAVIVRKILDAPPSFQTKPILGKVFS